MAAVRASISKSLSSASVNGGSCRVRCSVRLAGWEHCRGGGAGRGGIISVGYPGGLGSEVAATISLTVGGELA